jgi:hypothetical protein
MTKPSRTVTRKCPSCGQKFAPGRADRKFCSSACRQRAHRSRENLPDIDREIEAARLLYWNLIARKARALGRQQLQIVTTESQYVDEDGNVWMGGVLGNGGWRYAGKTTPPRPGWTTWGNEAAGPPWAPPAMQPLSDSCRGRTYERAILGNREPDGKPICIPADKLDGFLALANQSTEAPA